MTLLFSGMIGCWCGFGPYKAGRSQVPVLPHFAFAACLACAVLGGVVLHVVGIGMKMDAFSLQLMSLFGAFAVSLPVAGLLHLLTRALVRDRPNLAPDNEVVDLTTARPD